MTRARPHAVTAVAALIARDLLRLARRPGQIIASTATPALLWLVLVGGLADAMQGVVPIAPGSATPGGYSAYLAPGFALLTLVFSTVFASISLIEDRRDGVLRQLLVSGLGRSALPIAKTLAGAMIAWVVAAPLLLARALLHPVDPAGMLAALAVLALAAIGFTGIGIAIASRCGTARSFHGAMNLLFMPAWMLSGAVFPMPTAQAWIRGSAAVNPVAWTHTALRHALDGTVPLLATLGPGLAIALIGLAAAVLAMRPDRVLINPEEAP